MNVANIIKYNAMYRTFGQVFSIGIHLGLDLAADEGTSVFSVDNGEVIFSDYVDGFGSLAPAKFGQNRKGVLTIVRYKLNTTFCVLYGHLKNTVSLGKISIGDEIGKLNNFSNVNSKGKLYFAPHLHLGVYLGDEPPLNNLGYHDQIGNYVDPLTFKIR